MRVKIERDSLAGGLERLRSVVEKRHNLPILNCVRLESGADRLTLLATDLRTAVVCELPVGEGAEAGLAVVPLAGLRDGLSRFPAGEVEIGTETDNRLALGAGGERVQLAGFPVETYPKFPEVSGEPVCRLEQARLKRMLELTQFAASRDEMRYVLCGVQFEIAGNTLTLAATDGKRLAVRTEKLPGKAGGDLTFILPYQAMDELYRQLADVGEVSLFRGQNIVRFDLGGVRILVGTSEGEFPDYRMVAPKGPGRKTKVDRMQLLQALRQAAAAGTRDYRTAKFVIAPGKLTVSGPAGKALTVMPAKYDGKELTIGFEPGYFTDVLEALTEETVEFETFGTGERPVVFRQPGYLYFVLPARLR